jgi:hypothetical protein
MFGSGSVVFLLLCRIRQYLMCCLQVLKLGDDLCFMARIAIRVVLLCFTRSVNDTVRCVSAVLT